MAKCWTFTFLLWTLVACKPKSESQEILFVCLHGAARSPIAAAYFNKIATEKGLQYRATFRGTKPDKELTRETIDGLTNDGFDVGGWKPEMVSEEDIEKAFRIVTFDCSVPNNRAPTEWNGIPSISSDYFVARDAIKKKVEILIENLKD